MAEQITITIIDDLDGTVDADRVSFALGERAYEIDLSAANQQLLEDALRPFIAVARPRVNGTAENPAPGSEDENATGAHPGPTSPRSTAKRSATARSGKRPKTGKAGKTAKAAKAGKTAKAAKGPVSPDGSSVTDPVVALTSTRSGGATPGGRKRSGQERAASRSGAGRKVAAKSKSRRQVRARANGAGAVEPKAVREWARSQGVEINDRGPVPTELRERYLAAH